MTAEPRVEELLATIRRAIDHDINELDARDGLVPPMPKLRGTLLQDAAAQGRKPQRDADKDLSTLRQRVQRNKLDTPVVLSAPVLRNPPSLYEPMPHEPVPHRARLAPAFPPEPLPYYPPQGENWSDEPQAPSFLEQPDYPAEPYQQPNEQSLLSPQSAYAAQASFQALANAMMGQLGGEGGLQDQAREMLRPMLRQWLDDNLPSLVEKLVRDEIERVARRGR